jgi:hypothetical protein
VSTNSGSRFSNTGEPFTIKSLLDGLDRCIAALKEKREKYPDGEPFSEEQWKELAEEGERQRFAAWMYERPDVPAHIRRWAYIYALTGITSPDIAAVLQPYSDEFEKEGQEVKPCYGFEIQSAAERRTQLDPHKDKSEGKGNIGG